MHKQKRKRHKNLKQSFGIQDSDRNYYVRVSALNQEVGEGPYSNIIQLRHLDTPFRAPDDFHARIESNQIVLKWTMSVDEMRRIRESRLYETEEETLFSSRSSSDLDKINSLLDNTKFLVHLVNRKSVNSSSTESMRFPVRPFRIVASRSVNQYRQSRLDPADESTDEALSWLIDANKRIQFEYKLKNLKPNTEYTFDLSARVFNLESAATMRPVSVVTTANLNNICK